MFGTDQSTARKAFALYPVGEFYADYSEGAPAAIRTADLAIDDLFKSSKVVSIRR